MLARRCRPRWGFAWASTRTRVRRAARAPVNAEQQLKRPGLPAYLAALGAAALLAGCGGGPAPRQAATGAACRAGTYADSRCTPGDVLTVQAADVCTPGWAARHRHVTYAQRRRAFAAYGVPYARHRSYELDHLISLELGGSNSDRNLWPEPGASPNAKDKIENKLHREVCTGRRTLAAAQKEIRRWAK